MENYIVSARKYRPDTFDSVVGQSALITTLKNAISSNKLAHAYLFCGPRGVGKTTCARIFAKTINCLNKTADGEACNECESCIAFNEQRSYNIHELDAASNNTVDDIRQLIEMVRIQPQIGKYRVFIIDEVHMLSTQAFNAFLKTLEEPPAHAIFILATTEKHKLLPTILSRCQIYDFNRIGVQDIVHHLQGVAKAENIKAEEEALNVIAVKSDGGMRDALSMFDQATSFTRGNITYQGVLENLNVLDYDYYFRLVDSFLTNNVVESLLIFNEILSKGFEGNSFIVGLNGHFRDLLMSKDAATLALVQTAASTRSRYQEQAAKCSQRFVFQAMKICRDCELSYKQSNNKRLLVELALIEVGQLTEESDGERPKGQKKLKPITTPESSVSATTSTSSQPQAQQSNNTVREQPTAYNSNAQPKAVATSVAKSVSTQQVQSQTKNNASGSSVLDQLKSSVAGRKKVPTVSLSQMGAQTSLKRIKESLKEQDKAATPRPGSVTLEAKKSDKVFDNSDLNYTWQSFINKMSIDQKALAVRMRAMRIELLPDTYKFEVAVDNDLVANEFNSIKNDVESFLRRELKNDFVEMIVTVLEAEENTKAYSKVEKYQQMVGKNSSLHELKEMFGLEFN